MKLDIIYHRYCRQNFSTADFFSDIVDDIDPTYLHTVSNEVVLFIPISKEEQLDYEKKGYLISYHNHKVCCSVKQLVVTFLDIPEIDCFDICEHLLSLYGDKACKYRLYKEVTIGNPQ